MNAVQRFLHGLTKRIVAVALLALLIVCLAPAGAVGQMTAEGLVGRDVPRLGPEKEDLLAAIARFVQGDADGAQESFASAVKKNRQLPPADILMARLYLAANDRAAARSAFAAASTEVADDPEAWIALGEMAFGQGQVDEALSMFAKGLALADAYTANPDRQQLLRIRSLSDMAAVHEQQSGWADAESALARWIELDAESLVAPTRLGRAQFEQEKYKQAYATFTQLYEKDESVLRPEINMALLYEDASQRPGKEALRENANKLVALAVERMPEDLETRLAATQWALEAGHLDLARSHAEAALKIDPDALPARISVGVVDRCEGKYDAAAQRFTEAHLQSPSNFAAMNHLALTLVENPAEPDRRRALEFAQVNARLYGDLRQATGREATITLAWILYNMGREADAMRSMAAAGRAGAITPESNYYAARMLAASGKNEAARQLLEKALQQRQIFPHRGDAKKLLEELPSAP